MPYNGREVLAEVAENNDWLYWVDHATDAGAEEVHYLRENMKIVIVWTPENTATHVFRQYVNEVHQPQIARRDSLLQARTWMEQPSDVRNRFLNERWERENREREEERRRAEIERNARITEELMARRARRPARFSFEEDAAQGAVEIIERARERRGLGWNIASNPTITYHAITPSSSSGGWSWNWDEDTTRAEE